ncbi:MAG: 5-deoxy-glucuronate isomerase, partial [Rhodospirillales bacterium]|nr:5-deoxy-glucuronate isomerase [Rhodospirillales bacterium]
MALHLTQHRNGFGPGLTQITQIGEAEHDTGISLAVLKLAAGETHGVTAETETAWLLMEGEVGAAIGEMQVGLNRRSLFDESATCVHVAKGEAVSFTCKTDTEFTVYKVANDKPFEARVFTPEDVPNEHRG